MEVRSTESPTVRRASPGGGGTLADVLDRVLDKGIVIDAWARVSLVGLEILTVEARVIVASVETYLKYAEAIKHIELASKPESVETQQRPPLVVEAQRAESAEAGPSEDEVAGYLSEHAGGLGVRELQEHFHAPPTRLESVLQHLVEGRRARKDEGRDVFVPIR